MMDFDLDIEVIADFSKEYTFYRPTTTVSDIGRESDTFEPYTETVHLRKNSLKVTNNINEQGYNYESTIKITASRDSAIVANDVVIYNGLNYRVLDTNFKENGNYTSFIAGYTKEEVI